MSAPRPVTHPVASLLRTDASFALQPARVGPGSGCSPIEPLEPLGLSPGSSPQVQLCGGDNSSAGTEHTNARARALGIPTPLSSGFSCVLEGHAHKAHLHFTRVRGSEDGSWRYYCPELHEGVGLGELRGLLAYGASRPISRLECARWRERLDFEAGLRQPIAIEIQLPADCLENDRILASSMRIFLGLRSERFPRTEPFVFARDFAAAYSGLTVDEARLAKDRLSRAGVIRQVGKHGRSALWMLAGQDRRAPAHHSGRLP
jgi:hypothetical protein